jgi:type I restriction enzyme R subunit
MVFFSQKVLRKIPGNFTFVIVTDRLDLDNQIYKNFAGAGAVTEEQVQAEDGDHLQQLLREDHRYIFTLIQKFHTKKGETYPPLSARKDIIVITDEAHRSQYDVLALNMRNALPKAAFIAFTGTPLIVGEEKTKDVFGDYVSTYNFKQSVDDGATVALYYENRIPELQLTNKELNEDLQRLIDEAELDPDQETKLEREFAREYHLITRDDRLEKIAMDIVAHFMGRGQFGKAMVISIDKATAVRMFDKVQKYWKLYLKDLQVKLVKCAESEKKELEKKIKFMEETDMAVVVSQAQNEIEDFKKKGLDIAVHRKRIVKEDIDKKFKDADDPFRIVFVCAMWMTGFDVPSCSTIYLDKPMRNHTLMQAIARENRVFREKLNGLVVDYVGVFRNLQKALAIYGSGAGGGINEGETPVMEKSKLVEQLRQVIEETSSFCSGLGIDLTKIQTVYAFERIRLIDEAVDAILVNDESKRKYISLAGSIVRIYRSILPDPAAGEFYPKQALFANLAEKICSMVVEADISGVMKSVDELLDDSISTEGYFIRQPLDPSDTDHLVDLSKIDFEVLKARFEKGRKHIETEKLRSEINLKLVQMVRLNKSRMNYIEKLTEEELAIFDLLIKPEMTLKKKEEREVKKVAQELLETLKREKLVLDWRKRQQSRAAVRLSIDEILDRLPRSYIPDLYRHKCDVVYQHIYDSYFGQGLSIYSHATK